MIWRKRQGWEGWGPHPRAEASEGPCVPAEDSELGTPGAPLLFRRQDAHRNRGAEKGKLGTPDPPPHLGRRLAVPKAPPAGRWPGRGGGRLGSVVGPAHRRPGRAVGLWLFSSGRVRMALEAGRPRAPPPGRARAGQVAQYLGPGVRIGWGAGGAAGSTWLGVLESVWGGSGRQGSGSEQGSGSGAQCPSARRERMRAGVPRSGVGGPAGVQVRGGAGVAAAARAPISRGRAAGRPH